MEKTGLYRKGKDGVSRLLKVDFLRFGIVGAIGFSLTVMLLYIFYGKLGIPYALSVLLSNEGGLLSNFAFHENWTYKHVDHSQNSLMYKLARFHLSSWTGIALILLINIFCVKVLKLNYIISQVIASGIVMFWNFFWTKYFIFRGSTPQILSHPEETIGTKK